MVIWKVSWKNVRTLNLILDIPITKLSELWLWRQKMGINKPKTHWNRGVHSTEITFWLHWYSVNCPSYCNNHACIWVTHYEWNNSKEERFPLWTTKDSFLCLIVSLWSSQNIADSLLEILHNSGSISWPLILGPKQMYGIAVTCESHHP